jgi:hypothetical protein
MSALAVTVRQTEFEARSIRSSRDLYRKEQNQVAFREVLARYEAASWSGWKSWIPGGLQDGRIDISKATREEIMRKARYFEKNSAIARRLGSVWCDFTVGAGGMVFTPASSDPQWNENARQYLEKTLSVIDLTTRQSFGSQQQLIAWRDLFDGDCFIIKTKGQDQQGRWWPRIQIIEAHLCQTPEAKKADEGKSIIDGVTVDGNGRPTGYWFKTSSEESSFKFYAARDVIVVIDPDRANQVRGLSGFAAALNYLHRLDDLQELEFRAVTDAAEKSTFIKTQTGEIPASLLRPGGTDYGDPPTPVAGSGTTDPQYIQQAIGGRTAALKLGEDVSQFQPTRPTEATRALWSYLTSCVCAAIGIPKMLAFSEWLDGAQGTIVRGDYDIAAQMFRARASVYAAAFREVIIYVLQWGVATEKNLASPPGDWLNITTTAPRSANVDVGRNSAAELSELEAGVTNYRELYGRRGFNWMEELEQKAKEARYIRDLADKYQVDPSEISTKQIDRQERIQTEPRSPIPAEPNPDE